MVLWVGFVYVRTLMSLIGWLENITTKYKVECRYLIMCLLLKSHSA